MVAGADTVVDPGAVVVEALHTPVANAAVPRTLCPDYLAVRAKQYRVEIFQHGLILIIRCFYFFTKKETLSGFFKYPGSLAALSVKKKTVKMSIM
jgi:hypothetical protein